MKVYLIPNPSRATAGPIFQAAGHLLHEAGVELILDEATAPLRRAQWGARVLPAPRAHEVCDVVVTIGGDGTMLHAARETMRTQKPLLGVNVGRLGFLTVVESDELDALRRLSTGDYIVEHRALLCGRQGPEDDAECYALNDVVLFKEEPEHTISLDIYCDDILVSRFRGDGVIFATPTGSTAYSMSAGGPILDAELEGTVVTQICAHIVQMPPMVFSSRRVLRAVSTGTAEERVIISCDGTRHRAMGPEEAFLITQAAATVPLVQFSPAQQLESIDKKLKRR